jgi:GTP-binding protein
VKFIDEATITVQSGNGGRGCVSFRREKYIPRGGPDGGNGGRGGDIVLRSSAHRRTLLPFRYKHIFKAPNGAPGQGKQKTGRDGDDLTIEVPPGTIVRNADTGEVLFDFSGPEMVFAPAEGGRGGRGNLHFKSSTNRAPRFAQPGEPGVALTLTLELKLLADIGLVGLPNAGKSTLISIISSATPKIADYPFTTLVPNLGVVKPPWGEPFVVADIPGLIEGAHDGIGLGTRFLRHIERTRVLVHLIDAAQIPEDDPLEPWRVVIKELSSYSAGIARKPQIVVLNKLDLPDARRGADLLEDKLSEVRCMRISAATGEGVDRLVAEMIRTLEACDETAPKDGL